MLGQHPTSNATNPVVESRWPGNNTTDVRIHNKSILLWIVADLEKVDLQFDFDAFDFDFDFDMDGAGNWDDTDQQ